MSDVETVPGFANTGIGFSRLRLYLFASTFLVFSRPCQWRARGLDRIPFFVCVAHGRMYDHSL